MGTPTIYVALWREIPVRSSKSHACLKRCFDAAEILIDNDRLWTYLRNCRLGSTGQKHCKQNKEN
jgi:hypothetical protein